MDAPEQIQTFKRDCDSVGAGAGVYERMSVGVRAERSPGTAGSGEVVDAVSDGESSVRVAPV